MESLGIPFVTLPAGKAAFLPCVRGRLVKPRLAKEGRRTGRKRRSSSPVAKVPLCGNKSPPAEAKNHRFFLRKNYGKATEIVEIPANLML